MKQFEFKIQIEMQWNSSEAEALRKLKSWLEHEGHTTPSFGFALIKVTYTEKHK